MRRKIATTFRSWIEILPRISWASALIGVKTPASFWGSMRPRACARGASAFGGKARGYASLLLILLTFIGETSVFSQDVKIPKLLRRVTDFTNTLSQTELDAVEQDLARFEDSTSNQIVVVMIPTIGGEAIEDFALRTAAANQPGQKGKDNGVLLLIAKDDRKIRIEVGYGLEGVLPDGLAGQIIRIEITPYFRAGKYYSGIKAGIDAIMLATRNEYKAVIRESHDRAPSIVLSLFLFWLFLVLLFAVMRRSRSSARRKAGLMGVGSLPIFYGGGLGGGSHSSWGSSSGGSGFGGFSGGGGSFGGGGASGSW